MESLANSNDIPKSPLSFNIKLLIIGTLVIHSGSVWRINALICGLVYTSKVLNMSRVKHLYYQQNGSVRFTSSLTTLLSDHILIIIYH